MCSAKCVTMAFVLIGSVATLVGFVALTITVAIGTQSSEWKAYLVCIPLIVSLLIHILAFVGLWKNNKCLLFPYIIVIIVVLLAVIAGMIYIAYMHGKKGIHADAHMHITIGVLAGLSLVYVVTAGCVMYTFYHLDEYDQNQ